MRDLRHKRGYKGLYRLYGIGAYLESEYTEIMSVIESEQSVMPSSY